MNEMARRVRELRKRAGLSQAQLAKRLGKTQPWVSGRELGKRKVSTGDLQMIAAACGVGAEWVTSATSSDLLGAAAKASPDAIDLAIAVLRSYAQMSEGERRMVEQMIWLGAESAKNREEN